jgi:hypothetical protein
MPQLLAVNKICGKGFSGTGGIDEHDGGIDGNEHGHVEDTSPSQSSNISVFVSTAPSPTAVRSYAASGDKPDAALTAGATTPVEDGTAVRVVAELPAKVLEARGSMGLNILG